MSAHFDVEKDNARFFRFSRRIITLFTILITLYLVVITTAFLSSNQEYMHNWRGFAIITLSALAFLIYAAQFRMSIKFNWPPPFPYSVTLWVSMYLVVTLLALINPFFAWDLYVLFALGFGLFEGAYLWLAVSIMGLTLFAFQGILVWPLNSDALVSIAGQALSLLSITGFNSLFQHLIRERFERNSLFQQLTQANGELEEAHRQLGQSVVQEQELAILRERTRLAREMHDTIGHALVLISVKLEAAQRLRERDPERCDREMESTKQIARETMTALRSSIANLRTPTLEHEPIDQALSRATTELAQRTSLHVEYTFEDTIDRLPEALEETIWKVSQEAFTNIEKHAHAQQVHMRISQRGQKLVLHISDDGIGFPPALCQTQPDGRLTYSSPRGHYGLRGMRERIEAIGGHLALHSAQGEGTTIEAELPLSSDVLLEGQGAR
ncbi:sensor histidine kinase [Ktedonospora formicarum]|uniref:histidine kinase n=1 Tax=Ktedonospora formicarum TaxID=2778364 RepID=A0A8J3MS77_9CHLR|nr:sensor histidine kinase [Ktedonospora formicarum]GHO45805.1 sensor histidine kinase YxjM [Ktedonospora formicarum]